MIFSSPRSSVKSEMIEAFNRSEYSTYSLYSLILLFLVIYFYLIGKYVIDMILVITYICISGSRIFFGGGVRCTKGGLVTEVAAWGVPGEGRAPRTAEKFVLKNQRKPTDL